MFLNGPTPLFIYSLVPYIFHIIKIADIVIVDISFKIATVHFALSFILIFVIIYSNI